MMVYMLFISYSSEICNVILLFKIICNIRPTRLEKGTIFIHKLLMIVSPDLDSTHAISNGECVSNERPWKDVRTSSRWSRARKFFNQPLEQCFSWCLYQTLSSPVRGPWMWLLACVGKKGMKSKYLFSTVL